MKKLLVRTFLVASQLHRTFYRQTLGGDRIGYQGLIGLVFLL